MSDLERRDLTDVDLRLISILQSNGRKSNTQISKELGLTESTVRRRIDALIREEYIQIVALTDPLKIGFSVWVLVQAQVDLKYLDKVADELAKFPRSRS